MFFKNLFSKSTQPSDPTDELLELNKDGLRAFIEKDISYFEKVDRTTYNLFLKFRQDFIQSIAEITPEGNFERFKPNVTNDQIVFVTKHAKKLLEKILELKSINKQMKDNFQQTWGTQKV